MANVIGLSEEWKWIDGYEGLYMISNRGRVKSFCAGRWGKEMIRKPVLDKDGYLTVCLKKDGIVKNTKIHRLVASAFIPNHMDLPQVNHMDEDKTNNSVENLEWCTCKYNNTYNNKHEKSNKSVVAIHDGIHVEFKSIREASKITGTNETCISMAIHGKRKSAGGCIWKKW